jgi:hypothetical protein
MKRIKRCPVKFLSLVFCLICIAFAGNAQNSKQTETGQLMAGRQYLFIAQTALPSSGPMRQLDYGYDFTVSGDTCIAYLPYFGRAYNVPVNLNEGGIKFTSANFDYTSRQAKKGGWDITIKFKDAKDVAQVGLSISKNGYASIQVISNNREPISFNGYITKITTANSRHKK